MDKIQSTMRLELIDHVKLKKISQYENRSMANMIETLVKREIARYERENGEIILTDEDLYTE